MKDDGSIINLTPQEYNSLSQVQRESLVRLTNEQAGVLEKIPQEDRATLYPLMNRRDRRAAERAARKRR